MHSHRERERNVETLKGVGYILCEHERRKEEAKRKRFNVRRTDGCEGRRMSMTDD